MAFRIGCCLNLPPPTPTNSSFPPKISQFPICRKKSGEERPRRLPCAVGVVMIGLEMIVMSPSSSINYVVDGRHDFVSTEQAAEASSRPPRPRAAPPPKWSDTIRACQAWRVNSLESIVPENLPRPSARRRSEAASYAAAEALDAPAVRFAVGRATGDCFSM